MGLWVPAEMKERYWIVVRGGLMGRPSRTCWKDGAVLELPEIPGDHRGEGDRAEVSGAG